MIDNNDKDTMPSTNIHSSGHLKPHSTNCLAYCKYSVENTRYVDYYRQKSAETMST